MNLDGFVNVSIELNCPNLVRRLVKVHLNEYYSTKYNNSLANNLEAHLFALNTSIPAYLIILYKIPEPKLAWKNKGRA